MVFAQYEIGSQQTANQVDADFIKLGDVEAVREQLSDRMVAATPIMNNFDRMVIQGKEQDVLIVGSDDFYKSVRNLVVLAGRFLDSNDVALRQKVALLTDKLAARLYGSQTGRDRASDQDSWPAIHGDRNVQGEGLELRKQPN